MECSCLESFIVCNVNVGIFGGVLYSTVSIGVITDSIVRSAAPVFCYAGDSFENFSTQR